MNETVMSNGGTVSDWLGTAYVAATVAAKSLSDIYDEDETHLSDLARIERSLNQALREVQAVQDRLARLQGVTLTTVSDGVGTFRMPTSTHRKVCENPPTTHD